MATAAGQATAAAASWSLSAVLARYNAALQRYPMPTNMATGFVTASVGDLICQLGFESDKQYSVRRTLEMGVIRAGFMGPFLTVYFPFLARMAPGTATPQILKRLALDQVIGSPISIAGTFALAALLQGKPETVVPRITEKVLPTMAAGACFWPFLHFINFKWVPVHHQALVAHAASLGWNAFLSFEANAALSKAEPEPAAAEPPHDGRGSEVAVADSVSAVAQAAAPVAVSVSTSALQ